MVEGRCWVNDAGQDSRRQEARGERREARDDGVENIIERLLGASLGPDIEILRGLPSETPGREEPANEERHRREVQPGGLERERVQLQRAPQQRREAGEASSAYVCSAAWVHNSAVATSG